MDGVPAYGKTAAVCWLWLALWACPARGAGDWSGTWDTDWPGGSARLQLAQDGSRVSGTYLPGDGVVRGTATDAELTGEWTDSSGSGTFRISLSGDGSTFFGHFASGLWWTGRRVSAEEAVFEADLSSPRAVLRSFLVAANAVRNHQLAYIAPALRCLDQETAADGASGRDSRDRAYLFFDVIDRTTLRLADVPDRSETDEVVLLLRQAGTEETVELTVARRDGRWRLVVPPAGQLRATARRLAQARDSGPRTALEHLELGNPRATMRTFLEQYKRWGSGGRESVLTTLDLSAVAPALRRAEQPLLATYLKQTIDRVGYVIYQEIPDDPDRQLPYVHFRHPHGDIVIAPVRREDGVRWQFTAQTLATVRGLYERLEDAPLASDLIPQETPVAYFRLNRLVRRHAPGLTALLWRLEAWQWLALATTTLGAAATVLAFDGAVRAIRRRRRARRGVAAAPRRRHRLPAPLAVTAGVGLGYLAAKNVGLPLELFGVLHAVTVTILTVGLTWTAYNAAGLMQDLFQDRAEKTVSYYDELLVSVLGSVAKFVIVIAGLLVLAREAGIPLGGVVAGFSVGGLAISFAAKDTLANFVGSAVLLADRPFKRGDLVRAAGYLGTVEKMGLRSTQMRTREDSIVTVPNNVLVNEVIDNLGLRRLRRVLGTVSVTYDTPPEKLDAFADAMRETIVELERVNEVKLAAGVSSLAASSIDFEFVCYVEAATERQEREIRHRLIVEIARLAKRMEIELAFPTRTVHLVPPAGGEAAPGSSDPEPEEAA